MPIACRLGPLLALAILLAAAPAAARPITAAPAIVALELPAATDALPEASAPGTLLRAGRLRGVHIGVYAVSDTQLASHSTPEELAQALVPGAQPLSAAASLARLDSAPFATGAPAPDPIAAGQAWTISVSEAGMQSLAADALAAAGLNLAQLDPTTLRLHHLGREVALEELRAEQGTLAALRFYAEPGDRWNATSTYWLTLGQGPGLRMAARAAQLTGAPVVSTALERGTWRTNTILETQLPGPDGDHFFSADLRTLPLSEGGGPAVVTATLASKLPPASGAAVLVVGGGSVFGVAHSLRIGLGATVQSYSWAGKGTWSTRQSFPERAAELRLELVPGAGSNGAHVDGVEWELPVALELGGQGASFVGGAGRLGYRLAGLPAGAAIYELSDPERPVRLSLSGDSFEDEATTPRPYLVTGPGTLHTPAVAAHAPVDLSQPLDVQAVYVAPTAFLSALEPLLALRRAQGITVAAVSTEAIYDAWGGGQVSPEAIRSFLRYAAERWAVAPTTVVLVGDGSSDPRNYLGRGNITWVPPYLANADPWLGETACEACYARLHGDDPLADGPPDIAFGRIPAKSAAELAALVQKILRYEQSQTPGLWRATVAFVTDNPDLGGDFPAAAEASAALQPAAARIARIFYDPEASQDDPWRVADPLVALGRSMGAFDSGAAVIHYIGHGLQFQWGYTGPPLRPDEPTDKQYLLGLFGVDELRNADRLPVVLSMTCLTGSFQIPAFSGTSIDERLVARPDGGAIAAWSSTGLGVLFGHDALQRGFYRALWAAPGRARLGELTMAGYLELFATGGCCQESISTFALLGDPLTAPRVALNVHAVQLPLIRR